MTRVVLTQPRPRAERLAARLEARGHEVAVLSFRTIVGLADSAAVRGAFARLRDFDWVVLVSPGAIESAAAAFPARWPAEVGIAVIGPGSVQALRDAGVDVEAVRCVSPPHAPYDADALMRIAPFVEPGGARVLVVAGDRGRGDWIDALAARGAVVQRCAAYRNEESVPELEATRRVARWADRAEPAAFVVTSVDAAGSLLRLGESGGWRDWASRQVAFAPHARIAAALSAQGWRDVRTIEPGEQALCGALESCR